METARSESTNPLPATPELGTHHLLPNAVRTRAPQACCSTPYSISTFMVHSLPPHLRSPSPRSGVAPDPAARASEREDACAGRASLPAHGQQQEGKHMKS